MILAADTNVVVSTPGIPNFVTSTPHVPNVVIAPVAGPAGQASDAGVATLLAEPDSETRQALESIVVEVVDDHLEPPVDLTILLENSLA